MKELLDSDRIVITAPAGCGKTHLIGTTLALLPETEKRHLILTHTHAGVRSLRSKLHKLSVPSKKYHLSTIAGFAKRYALAYRELAGVSDTSTFDEITVGANAIIRESFGRKIITSSYSSIFIDEYQDCTTQQHQIALAVADYLPSRIFGDPLQGIFGFGSNQIVNWETDVLTNFSEGPELNNPYRWINNNPELGYWLLDVRRLLLEDRNIELDKKLPKGCLWRVNTRQEQISSCKEFLSRKFETVVGILKFPEAAHSFAKSLRGTYDSIDEIEAKDLMRFADAMQNSDGQSLLMACFDFAETCFTGMGIVKTKVMRSISGSARRAAFPESLSGILLSGKNIIASPGAKAIKSFLSEIDIFSKSGASYCSRKSLWRDIQKIIIRVDRGISPNYLEAAKELKDHQRIIGQPLRNRIIARPLLIKGLEFHNSVVLDADSLTIKELYVSLTRASNAMMIHSSKPVLGNKR